MTARNEQGATPCSLADEVNKAWAKKYGGEAVQDETVLCRRVRMLVDALDCAETNFRVTNKAYVEIDAKLRAAQSASVTTTNAAPQALQPADHGRGVDEAAQPTVGSREVATTPAGAAPSKSDLAHWLMACHEEREHPVYHDERFRLAAESIQSATVSPTRDDGLEEAAKYCLLSADLSERNGHRPLAAAQRAMAEILRSMKSAGTRQCGMCGNWARLHLDVSRGRCYMDGGITLNSDGCEDWKPMIVVAADMV